MDTSNSLLIKYLESVVCDDPSAPDDKAVGVPHSDRHLVLLSYLRHLDGDASDEVRRRLREAIAIEAERAQALHQLTTLLARAHIGSLILKGAALSYTAYPAPHLRPRNDDDLWVRETDFARACALVEEAGYHAEIEMTASDITRQRHFHLERRATAHRIDVHWWPVNPSAFDALPVFDACLLRSVPLPGVGPHARAAGPVDALLLACAHRVAHHTISEDAVWLCDLHFLVNGFTADDWIDFEARARASGVARICGLELERARETLGTPAPPGIVNRLTAVEGEASAQYLRPLGPLRDLWLELRARGGWGPRLRLLAHHVVPPREYVAARYGYRGAILLPFLYAHRAVNGLAHWTAHLMARLAR